MPEELNFSGFDNAHPSFRRELLHALGQEADPIRAEGQQAYMKSNLPFFGVTVPRVRRIVRTLARACPFDGPDMWRETILSVWRRAERREERYGAVELLVLPRHAKWLSPDRIGLAEELVVTGAWWDLVDPVAIGGVGAMLKAHPTGTAQVLRDWSKDRDIWKRRTAILSQLRHRSATDRDLLFEVIEPSIACGEFFLRKAIGWALREYSKTEPKAVAEYVQANGDRLSPLSRREALRHLRRDRKTAAHGISNP